MKKERDSHRQVEADRVALQERLELRERDEKANLEKIRQQQERIAELERDANFYSGGPGG